MILSQKRTTHPHGKTTEPLNVIIVIDNQNKVHKTFMKIFWHVL